MCKINGSNTPGAHRHPRATHVVIPYGVESCTARRISRYIEAATSALLRRGEYRCRARIRRSLLPSIGAYNPWTRALVHRAARIKRQTRFPTAKGTFTRIHIRAVLFASRCNTREMCELFVSTLNAPPEGYARENNFADKREFQALMTRSNVNS